MSGGGTGSALPQTDRRVLESAIIGNLERLEELCKSLESIADSLPAQVDISNCNRLAESLSGWLQDIHGYEESHVFPYLLSRQPGVEGLARIIERLRFEHWEDQAYAEEVQHALAAFAKSPKTANIESLSWMLRGFFAGVRRHVAFERSLLLPLFTPSPKV